MASKHAVQAYSDWIHERCFAPWLRVRAWAVMVGILVVTTGWSCPAPDGPQPSLILWQVAGDGWAGPAFDATAVYFPGMHHDLTAIDKNTGQIRWQRQMPWVSPRGSLDSTVTYGVEATMAGGSLIAMDYGLFGFDPPTGDLRWTYVPTVGGISEFSLTGSDGQAIYQGTSGGYLVALDGGTGAEKWLSRAVNDAKSEMYSPVPAGDAVYAGFTVFAATGPTSPPDSGGVVAVDAATGAVKWTFYYPRPTPVSAPRGWIRVAVAGDRVIAPSEAGLYGLDRATGGLVWTAPANLVSEGVWVIAASGNTVVAGFNTGKVVALDAGTGHELWRFTAVDLSIRELRMNGDEVFATYVGPLAALDAATGKMLWIRGFGPDGRTVNFIGTAAAIDSDRVYAAGGLGYYALRR